MGNCEGEGFLKPIIKMFMLFNVFDHSFSAVELVLKLLQVLCDIYFFYNNFILISTRRNY